jgi:hypothetical protein
MRGRTAAGTVRIFVRTFGVVATLALMPASALAQEPEPSVSVGPDGQTTAAPAHPAPPPPAAGAPPTEGAPLPEAVPAAPVARRVVRAPEPPQELAHADLDVETRRWAIGYTGLSQVPVGLPVAGNSAGSDITVPAIGLRYWISPTLGVDVGVGIGWTGGSVSVGGASMDKDSVFGFILQGGLPMALSTHRHVSFQVIPFVAVAHGGTSVGSGSYSTDYSGTRIDVGARAGLELFFGFIGIPELALSATVGIQFESRKYSASGAGFSQSDTTYGLVTTVQNNPWDIFAGNVAARYYF